MKKVLKWLGIVLGAVVLIVVLLAGYIFFKSSSILGKGYDLAVGERLYVPADSATVARGEHLMFAWAGCGDCHGKDMSGFMLMDAMPFAILETPNITTGRGGLPKDYSIEQFDRIVRHGIKRDGTGVMIMPSYHYSYISDEDLAAMFAYFKTLKPVDAERKGLEIGPVGRMVLTMGGLPMPVPEYINHDKVPQGKPEEGVSRDYGEYIARVSCIGCHAPNFSGGPIMGGDPAWPPAANITRGGKLQLYKTADDLRKLLREGERPDGTVVDPAMPVLSLADLTDIEIEALWLYLESVPAARDSSASWWNTKAPL